MANEDIERIVRYEADTSQAVSQLDKLTAATQKNAEAMDGVGGTLKSISTKLDIAGGFTIAKDVIGQVTDAIKGMIDSMDQLGKSAQQIGLTVDKVQQLQYAFSFAGVSSEQTVTALGRLTDKLADIDDMTDKSARSLRALGITASDDAASAALKMADAFQGMADGTDKTSIAVDAFGRSLGMKLIPALNEGSDAVRKLMEEHDQFGAVSEETAKQASEFNDKLTRLGEVAQGVGKTIVAELLPPLNKFLDWCLSMVGPISNAVSLLNKLNASFSAGAQAAKLFSIAQPDLKGMADLTTMTSAWAKSSVDAAKAAEGPNWLKKFGDSARDAAEGFAQIPQKIKSIRDAMSYLDPGVEKDALLLKSYTKQLEGLEKQLDGTTKKAAAKKTPAIQESDFEKWMDSMLKFATASDDAAAKVDWLQRHLDALAKSGDTSSEAFKRWSAELRKLQPDPVADALERIVKAAHDLDNGPAIIAGMSKAMTDLIIAGKGATNEFILMREAYLKAMAAAGDTTSKVTLQLEKMRQEVKDSEAEQIEWFKLLSDGAITAAEFGEGMSKAIHKVGDEVTKTKTKTKDLADAIQEASARFVTDWVGTMIDGFGKTEQSFSDMIESMIKMIAKLIVQWEIANALKKAGIGAGGNLFGGGVAQGAAWDRSGVELMATGGILNGPTFFNTRGRLAVAGEAGPEAVIPLQRSPSGNLGVAAAPVNVNVTNNTPAEVSTTTRDNHDGSRQIDIMITQKVKQLMNSGQMDRTMRSAYGLTRQPAMGG